MEIKITPTKYEDCIELATKLRQSDIDEVRAAYNFSGKNALLYSFKDSIVTYSVRIDEKLIMIYGVSYLPYGRGYSPWMLASEDIENYGVTFFRHTKKHIKAMFSQYNYLENHVDVRNVKSIQWLRWLGFTIEDAKPFGVAQLPFHRFWYRN